LIIDRRFIAGIMNQIYVKIPMGIFDNRSAIYCGYHESDLREDPGRDILIIDRRFIAGIMNHSRSPIGTDEIGT